MLSKASKKFPCKFQIHDNFISGKKPTSSFLSFSHPSSIYDHESQPGLAKNWAALNRELHMLKTHKLQPTKFRSIERRFHFGSNPDNYSVRRQVIAGNSLSGDNWYQIEKSNNSSRVSSYQATTDNKLLSVKPEFIVQCNLIDIVHLFLSSILSLFFIYYNSNYLLLWEQ